MRQIGFFADEPVRVRADSIERDALISPCGNYRYWLLRRWDRSLPMGLVNMINPSNGDDKKDDNTITSLIKRAQIWGWGGYYIGNLFAFRSPYPDDLLIADNPVGPDNDRHLAELLAKVLASGGKVVAAWGSAAMLTDPGGKPGIVGRDRRVLAMLTKQTEVLCLGLTQGGAPIHPLARGKHRVPEDAPLEVFRPKDGATAVKAKKEPPKSVHEVPPRNMPPLGSAPTGHCCYCGKPAEGRYSVPASPSSTKTLLPLCNKCGPGARPSLTEIWARIAEQEEPEE